MSARCQLLIAIVLMAGATAGCLGPRHSDYQSSQSISMADGSEQATALWDAIQETLRRHRFRLDRVDRSEGVVTTMPEMSQHFFELWRHDVDTRPDFWEATLNPIRRWVEVTVRRDDGGGWAELAAVVHKERFSSPDRQFNSTGAAYQYFSSSLPSTTGLVRVTAEHDRWLDLGRDPALEEYLLHAMLERATIETKRRGFECHD